jgi:hypothetical protein
MSWRETIILAVAIAFVILWAWPRFQILMGPHTRVCSAPNGALQCSWQPGHIEMFTGRR